MTEDYWNLLSEDAQRNFFIGDTIKYVPAGICKFSSYQWFCLVSEYWKEGMPRSEKRKDEKMQEILKTFYAERDIIPLDVLPINWGGGGIHLPNAATAKNSLKTNVNGIKTTAYNPLWARRLDKKMTDRLKHFRSRITSMDYFYLQVISLKQKIMKHFTSASSLVLFLLVLFTSQCRDKAIDNNYITLFPGKPDMPSSIKNEHDSLLARLHLITLFKDSTGILATKLLELMEHHFREEEDFVFPPLGLLPSLASGEIPGKSEDVIQLTEKLKSQLTHMSVEHQLIKASMDELAQAAAKERHPEIIAFIHDVHKHATIEEEVYFPAALLVGEYLKLRAL